MRVMASQPAELPRKRSHWQVDGRITAPEGAGGAPEPSSGGAQTRHGLLSCCFQAPTVGEPRGSPTQGAPSTSRLQTCLHLTSHLGPRVPWWPCFSGQFCLLLLQTL